MRASREGDTSAGRRFAERSAQVRANTQSALWSQLYRRPEDRGNANRLGGMRQEHVPIAVLTTRSEWALAIGATSSALDRLDHVLTGSSGSSRSSRSSEDTVPAPLIAYGAATVTGGTGTGRLAGRRNTGVQVAGRFSTPCSGGLRPPGRLRHLRRDPHGDRTDRRQDDPTTAARGRRTGNAGPLVYAPHSSFVTLGDTVGSSADGAFAGRFGPRSPLRPALPAAARRRPGCPPGFGCRAQVLGVRLDVPLLGRPDVRTTRPSSQSGPSPRARGLRASWGFRLRQRTPA